MRRSSRSLAREVAAGQLLLFSPDAPAPAPAPASAPDAAGLPDLAALFDSLNRRFFDGRLAARVEWSERLTASAGNCRPRERLIRISASYHRRRPDALEATMAHEMCHLLAPGHGPDFRRIARPVAAGLGLPWRAFRYSERWADLTRYRYVYACRSCGLELPSRKRRRVSCGICAPGGYDEDHRLVLAESRAKPGPVLLGERPARS